MFIGQYDTSYDFARGKDKKKKKKQEEKIGMAVAGLVGAGAVAGAAYAGRNKIKAGGRGAFGLALKGANKAGSAYGKAKNTLSNADKIMGNQIALDGRNSQKARGPKYKPTVSSMKPGQSESGARNNPGKSYQEQADFLKTQRIKSLVGSAAPKSGKRRKIKRK